MLVGEGLAPPCLEIATPVCALARNDRMFYREEQHHGYG